MRRLTALTLLVLSLGLLPAPARAAGEGSADEELTPQELVHILSSADPVTGLEALTAAERDDAAHLLAEDLVATDSLVAGGPLSAPQAERLGLAPEKRSVSRAVAASGCWYHYYFTHWTLYSASVASSWMQLNWCGRNGAITSYSISNVGGNGTGLSYEGNNRSTRDVGWEVRGLTTHRWDFWIGGVSKCMQVRGGATGLYSRSVSCNTE